MRYLLIIFSLWLFFFICYKYPLLYIIEETPTMPYLYLIIYIFFPLIPCLTAFILVNLGISGKKKYLSLNKLIFIYVLSLISMCVSTHFIYLTGFLLPEIFEIFSYYSIKLRNSIFPVILCDSDSESSSIYSKASSRGSVIIASEREQLEKSLEKIEGKMELYDNEISSFKNSVRSGNYFIRSYNILSKVVLYIPSKGVPLSHVFSEAFRDEKKDLLANRTKLEDVRTKFHELRNKRLEVLDKLDEFDSGSE